MNVSGERTFDAPRSAVWKVLNDPASMANAMPGVESFDVHDEKRWTANVKIPLGLGGLKMKIDMEKTDERELEFAKLNVKGTGVGAMLSMQTSFELSDTAAGATSMQWAANVKIAGPVGSMGQRVLQPIVNQQVQHVLGALDREVQSAVQNDVAAEPLSGARPPSGAGGAEVGVSPLSPEGYEPDPEGPTTSTEDRG